MGLMRNCVRSRFHVQADSSDHPPLILSASNALTSLCQRCGFKNNMATRDRRLSSQMSTTCPTYAPSPKGAEAIDIGKTVRRQPSLRESIGTTSSVPVTRPRLRAKSESVRLLTRSSMLILNSMANADFKWLWRYATKLAFGAHQCCCSFTRCWEISRPA